MHQFIKSNDSICKLMRKLVGDKYVFNFYNQNIELYTIHINANGLIKKIVNYAPFFIFICIFKYAVF